MSGFYFGEGCGGLVWTGADVPINVDVPQAVTSAILKEYLLVVVAYWHGWPRLALPSQLLE
jgi:hypothetical protein